MTVDARSTGRQEMFEVILDALSYPVFVLDIDSIVYVNRAAARLIDCPAPAALVGMPVSTIVHDDSIDASAERRRLVIRHRNQFDGVQLKLRGLDGGCVRATCTVRPIEHDGAVFVMATVTEANTGR